MALSGSTPAAGFADAYGESWLAEIKRSAQTAGIKVIAEEKYNRNDPSVTGQVLKLVSATHPPGQIMVVRGLFAVGLMLAFRAATGQLGGIVIDGDRVQVGEEEERVAALGRILVLHPHPVADRAEIIAEVEIAGRLNAGNDAHQATFFFLSRTRMSSRFIAPITQATLK